MSAHASGVFGVGVEPPPESSDPSALVVMSDWCVRSARSACVIWPILSASVMRDSRSATRCATGRFGFRYGSPWALMTTTGLSSVTSAPVAVSWIGIVFASDGVVVRQCLDGERLHAARRCAGRERHGAARVGVVGARRRGAASERVVHRDVVVERLVAVRRQLDADRRGVAGVDGVHRSRRGDVRGGRTGVHAVERELVDVELAVARARRLGQREAAHLCSGRACR